MRALVLGGGAYGLACAARMARGGAEVTLVEARRPAHPWAASGGQSRVLRFEYGREARYTELTLRARETWRTLEAASGETLFEARGVLYLAHAEASWERTSYEVVRAAGVPATLLDVDEVVARWPVLSGEGLSFALYSPDGGMLWARRATGVLARMAADAGVQVRSEAEAVVDGPGRLRLAGGERLAADVLVLCPGPWAASVDPRLAAVVPRRQVTAVFDHPVGDLPVFADGGLDFYGIPEGADGPIKIGWHRTRDGEVADPSDPRVREVSDDDLAPLRRFASGRLPGSDAAAITAADVCFYAMTVDEHPLIGWLDERTLTCCGLSGHGFKFAPVLAAAVAELALGVEPSVDLAGLEPGRPVLR